jgi:ring-1,2-phenylacetyl-CoA epoxidase subunit PaaD
VVSAIVERARAANSPHAEAPPRSGGLEARTLPGHDGGTVRPSRLSPEPVIGPAEGRTRWGFAPQDEPGNVAERAWAAAASVVDPEIPVLTIEDLGVLRDVSIAQDGAVEVSITPTYSGCPAMNVIALEVELALARAGIAEGRVKTVLSPAWTTDWMSEEGRRKLEEYGIAPPAPKTTRRALFGIEAIACPRCGSGDTERLAEFGSTACKALWRCKSCREPFDYFKCI